MDPDPIGQTLPPCPCGEDHLFLVGPGAVYLQGLILVRGPTVCISTAEGSWQVPRIYIAAHGMSAVELPALAALYGWRRER